MKTRMSLKGKADRSYDVRIGSGAIAEIGKWLRHRPSRQAVLISDSKLTQAREATRTALSGAGWKVHELVVEAGESLKDIKSIYPIYGELLKAGISRDSLLIALGGGTIGDAAGFVAATYLRGIDWVSLPTTLLAQVDSAVGGKTGINHAAGKNLIGAIYQPALVVCDTDFLKTLSPREIVSGFGEVLKYGLVFDPHFLKSSMTHSERFLSLEPKVLVQAIHRSLEWKCKVVSKDEQDRLGIREALNFGHTFGHALESATSYKKFRHGEAVIWGMRFALALSEVRGKMKAKVRLPLESFLKSLPVPPIPSKIKTAELFERMKKDKKVRGGKIHFVLLRESGRWVSDSGVTVADLNAAARLIGLTRGPR